MRSIVFLSWLIILGCSFFFVPASFAEPSPITTWKNQVVYVPLYSHIYAEERYGNKPFLLTATLSIRNTDPDQAIVLHQVDYYDSEGQLLTHYLQHSLTIQPLGSIRYIVQESEKKGGSGAKFLVRWEASKGATAPIIESISIGTKMQQGISFITRGTVIRGETSDE